MKLFAALASPFVRKVRIFAMECGLDDRIELHVLATAPHQPDAALAAVNPVKKIPTLVTDDGAVLYDSGVITDYLNAESGHRLVPADGTARWTAKRQEALADGLLDAAVLCRYETFVRPEEKQWDGWIDAQMGKIDGALDQMSAEVPNLGDPAAAETGLGAIGFGCALGYLDFRFPDKDWRGGWPALADWFAIYAGRPAMQATVPSG